MSSRFEVRWMNGKQTPSRSRVHEKTGEASRALAGLARSRVRAEERASFARLNEWPGTYAYELARHGVAIKKPAAISKEYLSGAQVEREHPMAGGLFLKEPRKPRQLRTGTGAQMDRSLRSHSVAFVEAGTRKDALLGKRPEEGPESSRSAPSPRGEARTALLRPSGSDTLRPFALTSSESLALESGDSRDNASEESPEKTWHMSSRTVVGFSATRCLECGHAEAAGPDLSDCQDYSAQAVLRVLGTGESSLPLLSAPALLRRRGARDEASTAVSAAP